MKSIKDLSDQELIELFKKNNYCFENMAKSNELRVARETIRREFIKRGIDYYKIVEEWKKSIVDNYNKNPKLCKHCGERLPWEKREQEYCSRSCSVSESNKGVVRNPIGNPSNLVHNKKIRNDVAKNEAEVVVNPDPMPFRKASRHNDILSTKYGDYHIPDVLPNACHICGEINCDKEFCKNHNFQQLIGFVKHLGFDSTTIGTRDVFNEFNRIRDIVYDLYWNQGLSCEEIKDKFNYSSNSSATKIFEYLNIPRRTFSESTSNAILNGKKNLPETNSQIGLAKNIYQEWHTTWTGESVFLRSSYETDYANYLDENQISYSVEDLRIEYYDSQQDKTRVAIPDFYISSTNEIVEIKSDFTLDIQEMLDKFEAYKKLGYIPKLVLEGEEVDIYRIEEEIDEKRLNRIKTKNINSFKNNGNSDID